MIVHMLLADALGFVIGFDVEMVGVSVMCFIRVFIDFMCMFCVSINSILFYSMPTQYTPRCKGHKIQAIKIKVCGEYEKLVLYHIKKDGRGDRRHSKFTRDALTFRIIVTTGKIHSKPDRFGWLSSCQLREPMQQAQTIS